MWYSALESSTLQSKTNKIITIYHLQNTFPFYNAVLTDVIIPRMINNGVHVNVQAPSIYAVGLKNRL